MATIRKLPNGRFRADIRKNYTFIQAKTFSSKKDAEKWSSDFDAKLDQILLLSPSEVSNLTPEQVETLGGREVFSKLGIELDFLTFHELVDEYIAKWNKKDENQIPRAYYWQEVFNKKPIKAITSADVRKALDQYGKGKVLKGHGPGKSIEINKQRSSNTVLRQRAVLSSIFKYAIKRGYLNENPVEGVSVDSTPNEVERFLDDRERDALLEACKKSTWNKMYLLVMMAITTGMRKAEILNLTWKDIDLDKGLAKLATTKNGSRRINPIPAFALDELKKFRESGCNLIFSSPTDARKPFNFRVQWNKALKRAGIKNFRFHDLRHTAASYLVMNGASLHETAELLGHKSTQTTKRYAHLSTEHKSALAERIMNKVFNG
ncbi:site-specific integrase [Methylomonas sp. LL1]|uniref:tyrosine-type recombinase/integrase n=1 Tax=Methylomonas sp. LL1 TaxID=2785785 RepID=UPI0018C45083|nr:site-specific integrase [Methylomonas sp. LL1]QPK62922.1 site-specific integrase [Methylomonas sp. LL1]